MKARELHSWRAVVCALAFLLLFNVSSTAQNVTFADTNLEAAVRQTLGIPQPTPVTQSNMLALTSLNATNRNITALGGLQYATNLSVLALGYNPITNLSALGFLPGLTYLDLNYIATSELGIIANMVNLQTLLMKGNHVQNFSFVIYCHKLGTLAANENDLTEVNVVGVLTNLFSLELANNSITDLSPLASLNKLDWLVAYNNAITNINPLSGLTNLHTLDLRQNQIADLGPVTNCTQITWMNFSSNRLTTLPSLAVLKSLPFLDVSHNLLTNIVGASGMNINWMSAEANRLETLVGLAGLTNLQTCILDNNYILLVGSLGLFTNITWMTLNNNNVQDIHTLTNLTHLGYLDLRVNLLDTTSGSPAMLAIAKMQGQGTFVDYLPQKNFTNAVVTLSQPVRIDPSHFRFEITGPPGISLKVLRSAGLPGGWSQIGTTFVSTGSATVTDSAGPVPTLFYQTSQ